MKRVLTIDIRNEREPLKCEDRYEMCAKIDISSSREALTQKIVMKCVLEIDIGNARKAMTLATVLPPLHARHAPALLRLRALDAVAPLGRVSIGHAVP